MSTTQVTPPPPQQTNQPQQQVTLPPEPQKVRWEAADGKIYEDTAEKVGEIARTRYDNVIPEFERLKRSEQEAREQLEVIKQATGQHQAAPDGQFDQQKYWQMMNSNPLEATRYMNQFVPEYQQVYGAVKEVGGMRQLQEANTFKADNPDFEANEANVEKLARTCQTLFPNTEVYNAQQMTAAYALNSRHIKTAETSQNVPPPPPKPSVGQGTVAPDINKMDQAQLAAYIRQVESQGAK